MSTKAVHIANVTLRGRLEAKMGDTTDSGCIEFQGYIDSQTGYGRISNLPGKPLTGHVASWLVHCGAVPNGMVVRHKCDNRRCVNIEHLELGTQSENLRDMVDRGRCNNDRSHIEQCPGGHEYDAIDGEGYRQCSTCRGVQARKYSAKKRARRGIMIGIYCEGCWYLESRCKCASLHRSTEKELA